jgi:hypothetical protein
VRITDLLRLYEKPSRRQRRCPFRTPPTNKLIQSGGTLTENDASGLGCKSLSAYGWSPSGRGGHLTPLRPGRSFRFHFSRYLIR